MCDVTRVFACAVWELEQGASTWFRCYPLSNSEIALALAFAITSVQYYLVLSLCCFIFVSSCVECLSVRLCIPIACQLFGDCLLLWPCIDACSAQVYMKYCDGGSFAGSNSSVEVVKGVTLHFRGKHVLEAMIYDLLTHRGM